MDGDSTLLKVERAKLSVLSGCGSESSYSAGLSRCRVGSEPAQPSGSVCRSHCRWAPMSEPIRIVVADDHPLFREGVVHSLSNEDNFLVVGEADSGDDAVAIVIDLLPDVAVLDIAMPGGGGIEAAQAISVSCPATAIVMLTVSEDPEDLLQAFKVGASGYVLKGVSAAGLARAVRTVVAGEPYVSAGLAGAILHEMTQQASADPFEQLTPREQDILGHVSQGLTNREIGDRLFIAEKTVKHYMTNVLRKLHVRSRVEAALLQQKRALDRE